MISTDRPSEFCTVVGVPKRNQIKYLIGDSPSSRCFQRSLISEMIKSIALENRSDYSFIVVELCDAMKPDGEYLEQEYYRNLFTKFGQMKLESKDGRQLSLYAPIKSLLKAERDLFNNPSESGLVEIVSGFINLCKGTIFNPNNLNLSDESFRKSGLIKELLCPAETPKYAHRIEYGFGDPFVAETILHIANNIQIYTRAPRDNSERLATLRSALFARLAERAFNRFMCIDGKTYRLVLNRHQSRLIACPRPDLSSIEDIKPIRLFEKIKAFIYSQIDELDDSDMEPMCINVCIVGHTEAVAGCGYQMREAELYDLLHTILVWYNSIKIRRELKLQIKNLINRNDYLATYKRDKRVILSDTVLSATGSCEIMFIDYQENFDFTTDYLCKQIDQNDMLFILDCPWLTRENFEIDKTIAMNHFCNQLSSYEFGNDRYIRLDTDQSTMMRRIDAQFNRIIASNTYEAGRICRVLKDYIPQKIEKKMFELKNSFQKKSVYLFLSESVGTRVSYLTSYPLQRVEHYEGKNFSIYHFCNYSSPKISVEYPDVASISRATIEFKVRLWSIIKYISISYAYEELRDDIARVFMNYWNRIGVENADDNSIDYIDIYRNVFVIIGGEKTLPIEVTIEVRFGKLIYDILDEIGREELYGVVVSIIKPLYENTVFSLEGRFGDNNIRMAFMMNIYSCISNELEMYFWHKYRMAVNNLDFREFRIKAVAEGLLQDECVVCGEDIDFIQDKWIYDNMLKYFEYNNDFTIGQAHMFEEVVSTYNGGYYTCEQFAERIAEMCRIMGAENSNLYRNAKIASQKQ